MIRAIENLFFHQFNLIFLIIKNLKSKKVINIKGYCLPQKGRNHRLLVEDDLGATRFHRIGNQTGGCL